MATHFLVSIPIEATVQDGVDASFTHKLKDGLTLGEILRVRVEEGITYLDIKVAAEQRNGAIASALVIAWQFVQLLSLMNNKGFEISLAGIRAISIVPEEPSVEIRQEGNLTRIIFREILHVSDHIQLTEHISSLDPILPLWERINQGNKVIADSLEWLYLGNIASNDRMAFLASWLALELLIEGTAGNEQTTTILKKYVPEKQERNSLKEEIRQVLKKYIDQEDVILRLIAYLEQAKLESDIDRWTRILQNRGIDIQLEEVRDLRKMRGAIVHQSERSQTVTPSLRPREVATAYLKLLLQAEDNNDTLPQLD